MLRSSLSAGLLGMVGIWLAAVVPQSVDRMLSVHGRSMRYEVFIPSAPSGFCVMVLHGASGAEVPFYRGQAARFAQRGYTTFLPHYFEATGSAKPEYKNVLVWVEAVSALTRKANGANGDCRSVALLGFSEGASVALAAGSQGLQVAGIAEWYGSLNDEFFHTLKTMPPLLILHGRRDTNIPVVNGEQLQRLCAMKHFACEAHFYPDEGHGFQGDALRDADERTLAFFARVMKSESGATPTGTNR